MYDLNMDTMKMLYHKYLQAMQAAVRSSPYFAHPGGTYLHNGVTNLCQPENKSGTTAPYFGGGQAYQLEDNALTDDPLSVQTTGGTCALLVRGRSTNTSDFIPTYSQYQEAPCSFDALPFVRNTAVSYTHLTLPTSDLV